MGSTHRALLFCLAGLDDIGFDQCNSHPVPLYSENARHVWLDSPTEFHIIGCVGTDVDELVEIKVWRTTVKITHFGNRVCFSDRGASMCWKLGVVGIFNPYIVFSREDR